MSNTDFHSAPTADYLISELGIDINKVDSQWQMTDPPPVIGMDIYGTQGKDTASKYAEGV